LIWFSCLSMGRWAACHWRRCLAESRGLYCWKIIASQCCRYRNYEANADPLPTKPTQKSWKRSSVSAVRGAAQFPALAATAGEIASIKTLFTDLFHPAPDAVHTLKQAAATEQQFRDQAPKFYNLHLATHGFFAAAEKDSGQPVHGDRNETTWLPSERDSVIRGSNPGLLSGLAFSGANREPDVGKDDGILTADEIASMSLNGVDLVVLSACETGLGEVAGGEGLLGVQRAFQIAGARSTVASLWQVDDVATRRLMERFYRNYWEKEMSKLDALREAQLYLLNNPEAVRGDARLQPGKQNETDRLSPQFWAAFSLSGDWR
jgi:CHAT domain-containing protein